MTKRIVDTGSKAERIDPVVVGKALGAQGHKTILVTAGPVYGALDPNKVVSNRSRGIWAVLFAEHLRYTRDRVILLIHDILPNKGVLGDLKAQGIEVIQHKGYHEYREKCRELAPQVDAMVAAAAVVNWIPAAPYPLPSKMETHGYKEGDIIQVPFMLAPRVVQEMKVLNPKLTLIGCKLLAGVPQEALIEAAYEGVLIPSRCNVVVANDLKDLHTKYLVYPDGSVFPYGVEQDGFYEALRAVIDDEHYQTEWDRTEYPVAGEGQLFDQIVNEHRDRFVKRSSGSDRVFGSLYVPTGDISLGIVSPREKGKLFSSKDAVVVEGVRGHTIRVTGPNKATLNAPLLVRVAQKYPQAKAVLHLHEQLPGVPTVPYAPPGTVRDNDREIPGPVFNIEGHGFIQCL